MTTNGKPRATLTLSYKDERGASDYRSIVKLDEHKVDLGWVGTPTQALVKLLKQRILDIPIRCGRCEKFFEHETLLYDAPDSKSKYPTSWKLLCTDCWDISTVTEWACYIRKDDVWKLTELSIGREMR